MTEFRDVDFSEQQNYLKQWHLHRRMIDDKFDVRASVDAEYAWKTLDNFGDENIVIAVADDGCNIFHSSLSVENKIVDWVYIQNGSLYSSEMKDSDVKKMFLPNKFHGSSMCSLIAGGVVDQAPFGVAPNCRLIPIRWEYNSFFSISDEDLIHVLDYISDKVDIMVNTWVRMPNLIFSDSVLKKIEWLSLNGGRRGKGILFIWSSNNSSCPVNFESEELIPYKVDIEKDCNGNKYISNVYVSNKFRNSLVNISNTIIVSSINSLAQRSNYSGYGPGISCCAPSNNSHVIGIKDVIGLGLTTSFGVEGKVTHNFKGTSGATALAAGVAALILSANDSLNSIELKRVLLESASKDIDLSYYYDDGISNPNFDPVKPFDTGYFNSEGWSPWFGYGCVNAYRGVKQALEIKNERKNS